jgi:hypothetical protein
LFPLFPQKIVEIIQTLQGDPQHRFTLQELEKEVGRIDATTLALIKDYDRIRYFADSDTFAFKVRLRQRERREKRREERERGREK